MADDTNQTEEKVEEVAEKVEEVAEAVEEVKEAVEEVKEEVKEVAAEAPTPASSDASQGGPAKPAKSVSKSLEEIIEKIEKLSVLELAELVHALEDKFGVTAAAPMAAPSTGSGPSTGEPVEEKTTFNVVLTSAGANKISVIKAVRELVPTLGLKEAKDLVEAAPKPVLEGVNKSNAEEAKNKLTAAGGSVELQ